MKRKLTHMLARTSQKGSTYYLLICQNGNTTNAITVYSNTPVIGIESMDELFQVVSELKPGESINVDFAVDFNNVVQCIIIL